MILPASQHFTKLIVSAEHIRLHHAGPQLLTASLREKYWIPRIRNLVKTVIHQCLTCYRFKAQATQQLTGCYHHREVIQLAQTMLNPSHYNWEEAVTSTKHHLRRTLGSHIATKEVSTLLAEIQACLKFQTHVCLIQ